MTIRKEGSAIRVTPEAVTWAFRLFLGREPNDAAEISTHLPHGSLDSLRLAFAEMPEFQSFYDTVVKHRKPRFGLQPFLLRPPAPSVPWHFAPPSMEKPVSQLCTAAQCEEPAFKEILQAMAMLPRLHRGVWQHVYVVSVLATLGCIAPGRSALGLGVRRERIPALLASRGVAVVAIADPGRVPDQEARGGLHLFHPEVVHLEDFEALAHYHEADLRDPRADLGAGYDAVWSCALAQHMGSVERVLGFLERSLDVLKPGGVAVHTFDFNISSDDQTVDRADFAIPRRRDMEALALRLKRAGHEMLPLNLHPGHDTADGVVDVPPYGLPHLKIEVGEHVVTSLGLAIRKGR